MRRAVTCLLVVAVAASAVAAACSAAGFNDYCTGIPDGGCPAGVDAGDCVDPTCASLYSYNAACEWTFVKTCPDYKPPVDAGHEASLADGGETGLRDAPSRDATFVLPPGANGGPGCMELEEEEGDCPLGIAVVGVACAGCEALWVCIDGGWNYWGACDEAGSPEPAGD